MPGPYGSSSATRFSLLRTSVPTSSPAALRVLRALRIGSRRPRLRTVGVSEGAQLPIPPSGSGGLKRHHLERQNNARLRLALTTRPTKRRLLGFPQIL
jgi:hypothetical protein